MIYIVIPISFRNPEILSDGYFFLHHHFTFVVKFPFVPMSSVEQVRLTSCRTSSNIVCNRFHMRSSFISSRLRRLSLRMCHFSFVFRLMNSTHQTLLYFFLLLFQFIQRRPPWINTFIGFVFR